MRSVELSKVALAAETLRLRRLARRQAFRAVYALVALVFALAALAGLHVLLWEFLLRYTTPLLATTAIIAADVVIMAVFAALALRNTPDATEEEAIELKNQAVAELKRSLTVMGVLAQVTGIAFRARTRSGARRGMASAAADIASRLVGR